MHVYAARTGRWKGIFAHHSWIVVKERGASTYTRFDKVAWGRPVKINNWAPDARWYGHRPTLVGAVEGPAAEALIPKIRAAVARYPYNTAATTRCGPGPTPTRSSPTCWPPFPRPGSPCRRPPSARTGGRTCVFGLTPSGTGMQLSLGGLLGITVGWVEGVEVNVLGLVAGIDLRRPAIKLPGFGRIGVGSSSV